MHASSQTKILAKFSEVGEYTPHASSHRAMHLHDTTWFRYPVAYAYVHHSDKQASRNPEKCKRSISKYPSPYEMLLEGVNQ